MVKRTRHLRLVEGAKSDKRFDAYSVGFVCASVCTDMSVEEATALLNREHPTGVGPWFPSKDKTFCQGTPMPHVCERDPTLTHYLFNC